MTKTNAQIMTAALQKGRQERSLAFAGFRQNIAKFFSGKTAAAPAPVGFGQASRT